MVRPLQGFGRNIHYAVHVVDFDGPDDARGPAYYRAEHESEGRWYVMAMRYDDIYRRRDQWFFVSRRVDTLYALDVLDRPSEPRVRCPGNDISATMPTTFASWQAFCDRPADRRHS